MEMRGTHFSGDSGRKIQARKMGQDRAVTSGAVVVLLLLLAGCRIWKSKITRVLVIITCNILQTIILVCSAACNVLVNITSVILFDEVESR
jgi:hypothetical protein